MAMSRMKVIDGKMVPLTFRDFCMNGIGIIWIYGSLTLMHVGFIGNAYYYDGFVPFYLPHMLLVTYAALACYARLGIRRGYSYFLIAFLIDFSAGPFILKPSSMHVKETQREIMT